MVNLELFESWIKKHQRQEFYFDLSMLLNIVMLRVFCLGDFTGSPTSIDITRLTKFVFSSRRELMHGSSRASSFDYSSFQPVVLI